MNHSIPNEVIDKAYAQSKLFTIWVIQTIENKQRITGTHILDEDGHHGEEPAYSPGTKATCSAFDMCYEVEEVDEEFENYGPNLWPPEMPEFQKLL